MDFDILDSLDDLGYVMTNEDKFKEILKIGPKSSEFTQLIEWFSKELQALYDLDSCVNSITDAEDSSSFLLEVSSFLKELHCPYKVLVTGPINQRLDNVQSRITLLDFLCTELQAARLVSSRTEKTNTLDIEVDSSSTATSLGIIVDILKINVPENTDSCILFSQIDEKLKAFPSRSASDKASQPALTETLTASQWENISHLYGDFMHEYTIRRELLLTRLDVTVQSFKWGEESQGKEKEILSAYAHKRKKMLKPPGVKLSDILAARQSIFVIEKTSNAELVKGTRSSIRKFLIPAVPDRGGRPKEQRPPVEMPSWMKRDGRGGGQGGNFRGRGQGRGNRHGGHRRNR